MHRPSVAPPSPSALALLAAHGITLTALMPIGATVRGLDLRKTPPPEVLTALESVMADRGFLVPAEPERHPFQPRHFSLPAPPRPRSLRVRAC